MKTSHGEYRRHFRTGIRIPVTVDIANQSRSTSTLNLSFSGLRLAKPEDLSLEPGQALNIQFSRPGNFRVPARVVHVGEHHVGLKLYRARLTDNDIDNLVQAAPFSQRARVYLRRAAWKGSRRAGVLGANTLLRPLLLKWVRPSFLFAVYGSARDVQTYYTPTMEKLLPDTIIGGVIQNRGRRGLLVASKYLESELAQDSEKVQEYIGHLRRDYPEVRCIALVGRLPNFTMKAGIPIEPPLVDGSMGTRYMIWEAVRKMKEMTPYQHEQGITVLGGAGRIGNLVCEDLLDLFPKVYGFDPRYQEEQRLDRGQGTIIRTANRERLADHRLFVALTHHGDVIRDLVDAMPPGALIADDTHPCISLEVRELLETHRIQTLKIVLTHHLFSMWPRMPAWNNRDIPGCLVEALVLLEQDETNLSHFPSFRQTARRLGFQGRLVEPLDE